MYKPLSLPWLAASHGLTQCHNHLLLCIVNVAITIYSKCVCANKKIWLLLIDNCLNQFDLLIKNIHTYRYLICVHLYPLLKIFYNITLL